MVTKCYLVRVFESKFVILSQIGSVAHMWSISYSNRHIPSNCKSIANVVTTSQSKTIHICFWTCLFLFGTIWAFGLVISSDSHNWYTHLYLKNMWLRNWGLKMKCTHFLSTLNPMPQPTSHGQYEVEPPNVKIAFGWVIIMAPNLFCTLSF